MTPLTNRELFYRDPTETKIPNDGVAQVVSPETDQQWEVLEWELGSFVCEGEYERGLERILSSYLANLSQSQQPAVWLSGFYGSGKSHLLRVLEYLWRNTKLPSGETAQSLADVSDEIQGHLRELGIAAKREGGTWSAAGTLAAGRSNQVRLAFLSVLFESAGLPEQYPHAKFMIWAEENGYLDPIEQAVLSAGKSLKREVNNLYVSSVIAEALLVADDSLGASVTDVRELLTKQFPPTTKDITDDELFDVMDDVLRRESEDGSELPLTLVVLDEMQQYIGEDNEKALAVQNIVEGCSARFGSQVLIVAAGQSALTATATLQKLTDRFALQVALSDQDVESVVRQVVLRKKPEHVDKLKAAMEAVSGEIDQQLGGTQLAAKAADKKYWVQDYPLLPTRRRFWELALRSIDRAGKAGVLRTQLKIVHEAAGAVADEPVGHVVGGDFLYDQQSSGMLQSDVLLKEIDELIRSLTAVGTDGEIKSRICALVFLISQIPHSSIGGDTGLRATHGFLADLLVEDLAEDGSRLRKKVPELLEELVIDGHLMQIEEEYHLQTEEGADWEQEYRARSAVIRDDAPRISRLREGWLSRTVDREVGGLKLVQGASKTARKTGISAGQEEPASADGSVPIWVRDEWSVTESAFRKAAAQAGVESPVVFVLLPKHDADQIKEALVSHAAAEETVEQKHVPQTEEGIAAERAMRTRMDSSERQLKNLLAEIVAHARVFQGGGNELSRSNLRDTVLMASEKALIRLFPKFGDADNPNWGKVVIKARDGAPDALSAVGHQGEPTTNPVCKEILTAISAGGTKGRELHGRFGAPPYGWPKDAVNGAVLTLFAVGNIRVAAEDGSSLHGPKQLLATQIGKVTLYKEDEPPTMSQRLAVKGLLNSAGITYTTGQEGEQVPALLQHLKNLADWAGGPQPLPDKPSTDHLDALLVLGGNQLFRAVADDYDRLIQELERWQAAVRKREQRETEWAQLERFRRHAQELSVEDAVRLPLQAIIDGRQLLDDPNPIKPVLDDLTDVLRAEVSSQAEALATAQRDAVEELEAWKDWSKLGVPDRESIQSETQLRPGTPPEIETDTKLLEALDTVSLSSWQDRISLVASRLDQAKDKAAMLLEPESVKIKPVQVTLKTAAELETYLDELRKQILPHLEDDKTVIL